MEPSWSDDRASGFQEPVQQYDELALAVSLPFGTALAPGLGHCSSVAGREWKMMASGLSFAKTSGLLGCDESVV